MSGAARRDAPPAPPEIRALLAADLPAAGLVLHGAFAEVCRAHGFSPPFPTPADAARLAAAYLTHDPGGCFVAARQGELAGVGFLHPRGAVASVGPLATRPGAGGGVGGALLDHLLAVAAPARAVRLYQDAFNPRSFGLYLRRGFEPREVVAYLASPALAPGPPPPPRAGAIARPMTAEDLDAVARLDRALTDNERRRDLALLQALGGSRVLARGGRLVAFLCAHTSSGRVFLGPGGAEDEGDLVALLGLLGAEHRGATASMRLPCTHAATLRRAFDLAFRVEMIGNLMVRGPFRPTPGARVLAAFPESL